MKYLKYILVLLLIAACDNGNDDDTNETPAEWGLITLSDAWPTIVLPESKIFISGEVFPDSSFGTLELNISGNFTDGSGNVRSYTVSDTLTRQQWNQGFWVLSSDITGTADFGSFTAEITVSAVSSKTGLKYQSSTLSKTFQYVTELVPVLNSVQSSGVEYFETPVTLEAENLCITEEECESVIVFDGCFLPEGSSGPCISEGTTISDAQVPVFNVNNVTRSDGKMSFGVDVFGVTPGNFTGEVFIRNYMNPTKFNDSASVSMDIELLGSTLYGALTTASSLGGFIEFEGDGFAPQGDICGTQIRFEGYFHSEKNNADTDIILLFVPEVISSQKVRIIVEENSGFGDYIDLRNDYGSLEGEFFSEVCCGGSCIESSPITESIALDSVKQLIQLDFMDSYVVALSMFGLERLDEEIRMRAVETMDNIYRGINIEIRRNKIQDYALYSRVEIHGADPNGLNLLGYDNTVGKDVGNIRLHDVLGGVNSRTQEDGYPGYGGVFLESYFGFSNHPPQGIFRLEMASDLFDGIFDEFRPDQGGTSVTLEEVTQFIPSMDGSECFLTSPNRRQKMACAVFVLGNMLGGTLAHELGHSFGLAQPDSTTSFHNEGNEELRLMDSGTERPFEERSGLHIQGFERFCRENYDYLRSVLLKRTEVDPISNRPGC
ncbi:hypothetical protein KKF34_01520 [Myxococcota bacterium]|nr:hypothetical protein [Myxococcota bacterium]MBU1380079.1 hypothetical protein [Myxococcota bacterium]MBU1495537.1 hypothetical protein [Myxococcota bacterium]